MIDGADGRERTDLTVPAQLRQVRVLRLVVAGTLSLHDFGTTVIEDVRSAVDEASALVLGDGDSPGWLNLSLETGPTAVTAVVRGSFAQPPDRNPEAAEQSEAMLGLFVDSYELDPANHRVSFTRSLDGSQAQSR